MRHLHNKLTFSIITTFICLILFSACSKDEEDDSPEPSNPAPTEFFTVDYMGNTYTDGTITKNVFNLDGQTGIEFNVDYSGSVLAEIDMLPILEEGSYPCNTSRGFGVSKGTTAWFSSSETIITIEKHNHTTKYVKGKVSGTLTDLFQTGETNNIAASFGFYYE